ncbi:Cytochrome c-552 [Achromobacter agilis]|uniref:Cytochrome c-552 n=2 Tax=Achromobacter agilis TaxID=1353888 RepID=A0A446CKV6_9BURK|nr:Cytochrome c-552 [Achromobacter agilis]
MRRPARGWRWRCAAALLLCATRAAAAGSVAPGDPAAAQLRQDARADYVLQCAGCHRVDGRGSSRHGIPDFRNSVGAFVRLPAGREYLIRVPGAAQSQLSNAELAAVLNWVLEAFSPAQLPADFRPYAEEEVAAARQRRYEDVVPVRHALAKALSEQGFNLADYSYGSDRKP